MLWESEDTGLCPVCSSSRIEFFRDSFVFLSCLDCSFLWKERSAILSESEEKKRYDLHQNSASDVGYVNWLSQFNQNALFPFLSFGTRILDFGCGPEPVLSVLHRDAGYQAFWYDKYFYPDMPNGLFDAVTVSEVFEHLVDPVYWASYIISLLKDEGIVCIRTQFIQDRFDSDWWYFQDTTHISFFTPSVLRQIFGTYQCEEIYCDNKEMISFRKRLV